MTVTTMKSEEARNSWRDILDIVLQGGEVIIQRYAKPQAVMVNYQQWNRMKLLHANYLRELSAEIDAGDYVTQSEIDEMLNA